MKYFVIFLFLITFIIIPESFSACIFDEDTGKYLEPCRGLPIPTQSLKQQIADNISMFEINCPNPEHVLTQRPNSKLACVTESTAQKLDWQIIYDINSKQ